MNYYKYLDEELKYESNCTRLISVNLHTVFHYVLMLTGCLLQGGCSNVCLNG